MQRRLTSRTPGLVAGAVLGATSSWNLTNVGAVADALAGHYGISLPAVGLFTTVMFFAQVLLHIPGGRLVDRFGPRRIGLLGLALILAANLGIVGGVPAPIAIGIRFAIGFGMGACFVAGSSYIRSVGGGPLAQGIYGGIALAAGGVALAVVPPVTAAVGWRGPFVTAAGAAAIGISTLLLAPPVEAVPAASGRVVWRMLRDGRVLRFAAVHSATFGIAIVLGNWVVSLLTRIGGYSESAAGVIGSLVLLGGLLGRPLGGVLSERRPASTRRMVAVSMVAGAVATVVLTVGRPAWLVAVAALAIGLTSGLPFGPVFTGAPRTHPEAPAAVLGALSTPAVASIVLGTPLVGLTFGLPGDGRIGFVGAALLWAATALVLPAEEDLGSGR